MGSGLGLGKEKIPLLRESLGLWGIGKWNPYGYEYVQPRYWESYAEVMNGEIAEWLIEKINAIIGELGERKIEL